MKIRSITDIITNSSSEVFAIKTEINPSDFLDKIIEILKNLGYSDNEIKNNETILDEINSISSGYELNYPVMCNVEEDDYLRKLKETFGESNVVEIESHYTEIQPKEVIKDFYGTEERPYSDLFTENDINWLS